MSADGVITDKWELSAIKRDCQAGATMLCTGRDLLVSSTSPQRTLGEFTRSATYRLNGPEGGVQMIVHTFWQNFMNTLGREGHTPREEFQAFLHDEILFGYSEDEMGEAFYFAGQVPSWSDFVHTFKTARGSHALKSERVRGLLFGGAILARWYKVDEGWAVSGSAIRSWLVRDDRSLESALALVSRVDDTLAILARER
jgi:hypothetical protein